MAFRSVAGEKVMPVVKRTLKRFPKTASGRANGMLRYGRASNSSLGGLVILVSACEALGSRGSRVEPSVIFSPAVTATEPRFSSDMLPLPPTIARMMTVALPPHRRRLQSVQSSSSTANSRSGRTLVPPVMAPNLVIFGLWLARPGAVTQVPPPPA